MPDVEVEPHADGVGGHQVVDLARLEERDLRVARARRERAHHHRRPAPQRPQPLGQRVDLVAEKATTALRGGRRASFSAPVQVSRESRAQCACTAVGKSSLTSGRIVCGPQQQRLLPPARPQQPLGEDVPAPLVRASWISSTARKSTSRSTGIASTVQTQ